MSTYKMQLEMRLDRQIAEKQQQIDALQMLIDKETQNIASIEKLIVEIGRKPCHTVSNQTVNLNL